MSFWNLLIYSVFKCQIFVEFIHFVQSFQGAYWILIEDVILAEKIHWYIMQFRLHIRLENVRLPEKGRGRAKHVHPCVVLQDGVCVAPRAAHTSHAFRAPIQPGGRCWFHELSTAKSSESYLPITSLKVP